jgi:hypothetical protein
LPKNLTQEVEFQTTSLEADFFTPSKRGGERPEVPRTANKWDQRIDRARDLAEAYPFSAQILRFYSKLTTFQKSSYGQFQSSRGLRKKAKEGRGFSPAAPMPSKGIIENSAARLFGGAEAPPFHSLPTGLDEGDLGLLITRWGPFLAMLACEAPTSLAESARGLNARGPVALTVLLHGVWPENRSASTGAGEHEFTGQNPPTQPADGGRDPENPSGRGARAPRGLNHFERFCAQAFLQPYAEFLADQADVPTPAVRRPTCPYCGSPPLVGVLRQEGDGAKRSLVCSFCRTEWDYLRIACVACEERREEKLCVYSTPAFDCVRVEACDTCRAYIKTIDLTQNGLAIPEVDELAAIPLTLWADEKGYQKVARNIIGL